MSALPPPAAPDPYRTDHRASLVMAKQFGSVVGECFHNCIVVTMAYFGAGDAADLYYVEGNAITPMLFPTEHGWIRRGDTIFDPTWCRLFDADKYADVKYFTAVEYPAKQLARLVVDSWEGDYDLRLPLYEYAQGHQPRLQISKDMLLAMRSAWHTIAQLGSTPTAPESLDDTLFKQLSHYMEQA